MLTMSAVRNIKILSVCQVDRMRNSMTMLSRVYRIAKVNMEIHEGKYVVL